MLGKTSRPQQQYFEKCGFCKGDDDLMEADGPSPRSISGRAC